MKIHRFLGNFNFKNESIKLVDKSLLHQLTTVLRMKPGAKLELVSRNGSVALAELTAVSSKSAEAKILELLPQEEDGREVALFVAILKKENFEWVLEKATEIGVSSVTPIITKRTVKTGLKEDRLSKIITEATEQSGRPTLLKLEKTLSFEEAINSVGDFHKRIIFDQSGDEVRNLGSDTGSVALFIGPEGGWEESELTTARELSFSLISLGKNTLRAETAAIVASFLGVHGL
ncbi:MAG: 16S rRNA (uracil(1498)-N(3))-methyltransferase [Anaplasmataceae bacterium]|nr:16S rRNA (uracil(1498)-N(3))-methyltransferase [Anaplasmataceae bacterium]